MKKLAWLFAALSICACSFTACGDDDSNDSKAKENESCAEATCDDGLVCNETSKICEKAKAAKGESCAEAACADGLVCNETSKICEDAPAPAKAKKGESCEKAECESGLVCGDDKKCAEAAAPAAKAKKGESCETLACEDGLVCGDDKKCAEASAPAEKAKKGESCETLECDENLKCNDESKICEEIAADINCDDLAEVKTAVDAVVALEDADLEDCEKFTPLSDAVAAAVDNANLEFAAVEAACFAGWGVAAEKQEAIDNAVAACSPSESNCETLSNVKAAVEAVAALTEDDLKDCDKLSSSMDAVNTAMVSDNVYTDSDSDADKESKANAVLSACAEDWGMTEEKQNAVNAAEELCNTEEDLCKDKKAGDTCGEDKVCTQDGEALVCKESAVDPCKDKKAGDSCGENKECTQDGEKLVCKEAAVDPCKDKKAGASCGENKVCTQDGEALVCKEAAVDPCKDKKAGDSCGENKECTQDGEKLVCQEKPADPCKDKKANDACGANKICDKDLKCIDNPVCALPKVETAVKAVVALSDADLKDCEKVSKSTQAIEKAMIESGVYKESDSNEEQESKFNEVANACFEGWGLTETVQKAVSDAIDLCGKVDDERCKGKKEGDICDNEGNVSICKKNDGVLECIFQDLVICEGKNAGDECGENKVCTQDGEKLVCQEKQPADPCEGKKEGDDCGENMVCGKDEEGKLVCAPKQP